MNPLLRTQLQRYFGTGAFRSENVAELLHAVSAAYDEADERSNRLAHSIAVMSDVLGRPNAELQARNARLEHLNTLVGELARHVRNDPQTQSQHITETCGRAFEAARASLWSVESDRMRCVDLYELETGTHSSGVELLATSYPMYFAAVHAERSIAAHDARTDPRTSEFTDGYLIPLGITSMLDSGAFADNELRAVLCIEHTGAPRRWTAEEIAFAGSVTDLVAVVFESRKRRETQAMLDHQRAFLRQVIDLIPNMIFAKDRDGRYMLVNDAIATFYGTTVAELLGKRDEDFNVNAEQIAQFRRVDTEVLDTMREHVVDAEQATNARGEVRWMCTVKRPIVEPNGSANLVLGVATDITAARSAAEERLKLEASLRQVQKLESLGLLAGGIAHDLNNIMTPILITSSMLLEDHDSQSPLYEDLTSILTAAESARELTGQLLAFGRKQVLSLTTVDINTIIAKTVRMISRLIPPSIRIDLRLAHGGALVRADAAQMNQVLVNLIINACDATADRGTITITTTNHDENTVTLRVEDTGTGMDELTASQIFDPFFTTKELGRGTGLGLATVHGIVEQHQGRIAVETQLGHGTRFTITMPRRERLSAPVPIHDGVRHTQTSTVLVVEDESPIRRLVQRVLASDGHVILTAEHAEQALAVVRGYGDKIDLLLTDVVLPGMSGPMLYEQLRPSIDRVVFMSGHARDGLNGKPLPANSRFLRKPFTAGDLNSIVHSALGAT
ncbi:MAG: ATP-binding protein [Myxococcota bacterium]|nr:ATP-binding protein [Myxococcota bacterium]